MHCYSLGERWEKEEWAAYDSDTKYHIIQGTTRRSSDGLFEDDDVNTFLEQN